MSIINEALKKAQESRQEQDKNIKEEPDITPSLSLPPSPAVKRPSGAVKRDYNTIFWILPAIAVIAAGVVLAKNLLPAPRPQQIQKETRGSRIYPVEPTPEQKPAPPSEAREADIPLPALKLSGIVYDENSPYAIVNGAILREGEVIDGAKLVEIKKERVKFEFNGREFEIKPD